LSKIFLRKKQILLRKKNYQKLELDFFSLKKKINISKNHKIGAYYPVNYEINCLNLFDQFKKNNNLISLPVIKKNYSMDFYEWDFDQPLNINHMGIPEPYPNKRVIPDILLVPLVAFDKRKFRLGYGGGYYDRYIDKISKTKKIFTVGLAFASQEVKKLPIDLYDKKLDLIFTEKFIR